VSFRSLLSLLLGNFDADVFLSSSQRPTAVVLLLLFVIVSSIVLLNLLIAIVSGVHEETMRNKKFEFLKAKVGPLTGGIKGVSGRRCVLLES
jgi:hypothetical protein